MELFGLSQFVTFDVSLVLAGVYSVIGRVTFVRCFSIVPESLLVVRSSGGCSIVNRAEAFPLKFTTHWTLHWTSTVLPNSGADVPFTPHMYSIKVTIATVDNIPRITRPGIRARVRTHPLDFAPQFDDIVDDSVNESGVEWYNLWFLDNFDEANDAGFGCERILVCFPVTIDDHPV